MRKEGQGANDYQSNNHQDEVQALRSEGSAPSNPCLGRPKDFLCPGPD